MNILIIEDEPRAAAKLSDMLCTLLPDCSIAGTIPSVAEAVKYFKNQPMPDLILMDINLADGSCFSIFEVTAITAPIIFCTAYDEYALKAFQTNGFAYLLKPVTKDDLQAALNKLTQLTKHNRNYKDFTLEDYKTRFLIQAGEKLFPVLTHDISFFNLQDHGLKLFKSSGENYFVDYTVTELEDLLNPAAFFRINRQTIVAKNAIASSKPTARNAQLVLENGAEFSISRERIKPFRKWFET